MIEIITSFQNFYLPSFLCLSFAIRYGRDGMYLQNFTSLCNRYKNMLSHNPRISYKNVFLFMFLFYYNKTADKNYQAIGSKNITLDTSK